MQAPLARNSLTSYSFNTTTGESLTSVDQDIDAGVPSTSSQKTDIKGELRQVTNRKGKVYNLAYNALGQLTSTVQPGGRTLSTAHAWNVTGPVQTLTEPSGQVTTLQSDNVGRFKTRTGPDATTQYGYDASGNLLTVTEGAAVITRTYETTRDALSTYTNAAGEVIAYTYDANGNLSTLTYPGGKVVQYAYDSRDRLRRVTDWAGRATTFEYDAAGRLRELRRPNGTVRRTEYDAAGQMVSLVEVGPTGQLIALQSWRYDLGGRPAQRLRSPAPAAFATPGFTATHHDDNRLATLTPQGGASTTVTSDLDGNITSVPLWEGNGAWTGTSLTWDARNRLQSVSQPALVSYGYDAEGNLISRTQAASVTRYTVNPGAALSQTLITHHADGTKTFYVHGAGLLYEEKFSSGGASLGTRSYHYDQVGSTVALSNGSGVVTGRLEYTAYGLTSHTSGVVDTVFRYNGQYGVMTDPSTGLLNMRARWYSPALGRFLSEDPIGFSGGMNWYAYADGNPISAMDPFGLCAVGLASTVNRHANSFAAFVNDGAINAFAGMAWTAAFVRDQVHHIAGGNWSSIGTTNTSVNAAPNVYGNKGYYDTAGSLPVARDMGVSLFMGYKAMAQGVSTAVAAPVANSGTRIGATGQVGEAALKQLGGEPQAFFNTSHGARYVDQFVNGIANEAKVGYQTLTSGTRLQVMKDIELMQTQQVQGVIWNFYMSPVTGKIGPSGPLGNLLNSNNIPFTLHY